MDTEKKTVGKVVLVTSANPDSGKTFITLNLGMSMALANVKVVILDLDLRKGFEQKRRDRYEKDRRIELPERQGG